MPSARSSVVTAILPFIQLTSKTGAVFRVVGTAEVAPVSSTLLVKTRIAPDSKEYFVSGRVIFRNTRSGSAPRDLAVSSSSGAIPSMEAAIARAARLAPASGDSKALWEALQHLDARISIETHALRIELNRSLLAEAMAVGTTEALIRDAVVVITPVSLKRRGIELRLVYASPDARPANRDPHLINMSRRGWAAWKKLTTEQ